jgi:hypothetical protein
MGIFFNVGEAKTRAGVYQRYENYGGGSTPGALDGIVAAVVQSNWGELGKILTFESVEAAKKYFGTGGAAGTINLLTEIAAGGARVLKVVRIGTGGTKSTGTLNDTAEVPAVAINLTAKYEGDRTLIFEVRVSLADGTKKEFLVYEGTTLLEKITFDGSVDGLIAATSAYFTFAKAAAYAGTNLVVVTPQTPVTAGTNPVITNGDYSDAFVLLEPHVWNTICIDTVSTEVHTLLAAYITRVFEGGKMSMAVVGEPISVAYETRLAHAKAFNTNLVVYCGGGFYNSSDVLLNGYLAAGRVAGLIAATPSNQSLTHKTISGAVRVAEVLTNEQYNQAIDNGMLTFSTSAKGIVWIDSGINTLTTLTGENDEGWKKIKRTKVRFELMQRASEATEPLVGQINNDDDGRATVIQAVQGVINQMIAPENKLAAGATIIVDPDLAPAGDSAWFRIYADDIDSLDKGYFAFMFRYAAV